MWWSPAETRGTNHRPASPGPLHRQRNQPRRLRHASNPSQVAQGETVPIQKNEENTAPRQLTPV